MYYLKTNKAKLLAGLVVVFILFQIGKFFVVRINSMDLPKGRIIFSSPIDGDEEIYSMSINGTNFKKLTRNSASKINISTDDEPSFSSDGKKIVFRSSRSKAQDYRLITNERGRTVGEEFSGGAVDIFLMDSDGRNQISLTYRDLCSDPFFSPDGKKIVFRSRKPWSLRIMNIDTNQQGVLNFGGGIVEFSPDGKKIYDNFKGCISVSQLDDAKVTKLVDFVALEESKHSFRGKLGVNFAVSTNGEKISVITTENVISGVSRFYLVNADGSGLEEIYKFDTEPLDIWSKKFSPDGRHLIINAGLNAPRIYSLDLSSHILMNLTDRKDKWRSFKLPFTFTPDGKRIIFMADILPSNYLLAIKLYTIKAWLRYFILRKQSASYDNKYLCIMDIDGKNYRRITKMPEGTELGRDFIHWEK